MTNRMFLRFSSLFFCLLGCLSAATNQHLSLFLPENPRVICVDENQFDDSIAIDLLQIDHKHPSIEILKNRALENIGCIYLPNLEKNERKIWMDFLEPFNFRQVTFEIYLKGTFFDDFATQQALNKAWEEIKQNYQRYYVYFPLPGIMVYLDDVPDSIKSILKTNAPWEGNTAILIKNFTKEGTVVVDIGAHIGLHTITMSRKAGPNGLVITFEPQRKLYLEQLQNLKFNNCKNVVSICKAVGEKKQKMQLTQIDQTNEGGTAIGEGGEWVEMIPLDSLNLSNVSLIKIDVENYEFFALAGAKETILRNKPTIMIEINGSNINPNPEEEKKNYDRIADLIQSLGYEMHLVHNKDYIAVPVGVELGFNPEEVRNQKDYLRESM